MLRPQTISKTYVGEWGFTNGYFVVRLMTWVGGVAAFPGSHAPEREH